VLLQVLQILQQPNLQHHVPMALVMEEFDDLQLKNALQGVHLHALHNQFVFQNITKNV
jgi:hypothetical protein